jgi:glycosyltransferase involved in cell wall biosynthesis
MLRGLDLVAVPSLSDEQPRVPYDCFSQAVPVVGSDTPGILQCVTDGRDGKIVPAGDAQALADAIAWAAADRAAVRDLGIAALDTARELTHDKMHSRRAEIILAARRGAVPTPA